jgi:hypothetical protein
MSGHQNQTTCNLKQREFFVVVVLKRSSEYDPHPVRLAYQPPASSTFLSEQTNHQ